MEDSYETGFNSMIVRLKVFQKNYFADLKLFQFYDSPIKSLGVRHGWTNSSEFQFYDSPIKSKLIDL